MADELETTVGPAAGEGAGDPGSSGAVSPEASGGDGAGESDAAAEAERARDEYIARVAAQAAKAVVEELVRENQPAPAAGTPPTPAASGYEALEAERQAIIAEQAALDAAIRKDGITGELILRRSDLSDRKAEFMAKVNMHAMRIQETSARVAKSGDEPEWLAYAAQHPGVPVDILRKAYDHDHPKAPAKPGTTAAAVPGRAKPVDVSGAGERGAASPKVPTMTLESFNATKARLRDAGKHDEAAKLDRQVRSREVLLKG